MHQLDYSWMVMIINAERTQSYSLYTMKKLKKKLKLLKKVYGNHQKAVYLNVSAFSIFSGMQKAMIVIISTMSMLPLKILALNLLI